MIIERIENWDFYRFGPAWEMAFGFLESLGPESEERKYSIDGDRIFACVDTIELKPEGDERLAVETHKKYVDIHRALQEEERIGC